MEKAVDTVGGIIWKQIPVMTKMAVGAREAMLIENGLKFKAGRSLFVEVILDPSDTYNVEVYRIKRGSYTKVVLEAHTGVYEDSLGEVIYRCVNK